MDHPWYAQSTLDSVLRVALLPLRFFVALAGMVAPLVLLMTIPGISAPFDIQSFSIAAASIAIHGLGFLAFCWKHDATVNAWALRRLKRRNRRALHQPS